MEVDYYSKYLKYKAKYLELKKQMGGEDKPSSCCIICNCIEYNKTEINYEFYLCSCGHPSHDHIFNKPKRCEEKINLLKLGTKCCSCNCSNFEEYINYNKEKNPDLCKCKHPLSNHKKIKQCPKPIKTP